MPAVKSSCRVFKLCGVQASNYKLINLSDDIWRILLLLEDPYDEHIAAVSTVLAM